MLTTLRASTSYNTAANASRLAEQLHHCVREGGTEAGPLPILAFDVLSL